MSCFSDLSVTEVEETCMDNSFPSPETQLRWRLEDLIHNYLSLGGNLNEVESIFEESTVTVSSADNELLYSANSFYSVSLIIRCIRIAWAKLSAHKKYIDEGRKLFGTHNDYLAFLISHCEQTQSRSETVA